MAGYIDKGKITSIDGNSVRVVPCNESGLVSARVVIPWHLRSNSGNLTKGTEVIYAIFDDQTGILIGRADGNWGSFLPGLTVGGTLNAAGVTADEMTAGSIAATTVEASGGVSGSSVTANGVSLGSHKHSVTEGATETGTPS